MKKLIPLVLCLLMLASAAVAAPEISANWMDFQVMVGDELYTLPAPVSEFEANGWALKDEDETLKPNQYTFSQKLVRGDEYVYTQVINLGIDELPLKECLIGEVSLDSYDAEKGGAVVTLAGGITLGSSKADVEATYGNPGRIYEGSSYTSYTYEGASYDKMELQIDLETDAVIKVGTRSFETPAGYNDAALAEPVEMPQIVADWTPPTELGNDLLSFNLRIGETIYQFPAPYTYMQENGWVYGQAPEGKVSAYDRQGMTALVLGGYKANSTIYNLTAKATTPEYCFITSLRVEDTANLDVELPGGITFDMTEAEVKAALDAQPHEVEISEHSASTSYVVKKDSGQEVKIVVNHDKDKVMTIEVTNTP